MRVLVTGSRDWDDQAAVNHALDDAVTDPWVTIVHGGCLTGADAFADRWARDRGHPVNVWHAEWSVYGRAAGPIRNASMVHAGADVCLAFIRGGSAGATGCADAAEAAGIPTRRFLA